MQCIFFKYFKEFSYNILNFMLDFTSTTADEHSRDVISASPTTEMKKKTPLKIYRCRELTAILAFERSMSFIF